MARAQGPTKRARHNAKAAPDTSTQPADAPAIGSGGLSFPSPLTGTNLVIADVVLRAAGGLLRNRLEKGLLSATYDKARADRIVDNRSVVTTMALWSASRLARRSPLGLAVVAGGLAAKVLYDRGKQVESKRRVRKLAPPAADSKS